MLSACERNMSHSKLLLCWTISAHSLDKSSSLLRDPLILECLSLTNLGSFGSQGFLSIFRALVSGRPLVRAETVLTCNSGIVMGSP